MYCPKCGGTNGDGAFSCSSCSTKLNPSAFQGRPAVPNVPNYLFTGIVTTLCCCMPAGIASIVYATQANGRLETGDYVGALEKSRQAYTWAWVAFGVGLGLGLLRMLASS